MGYSEVRPIMAFEPNWKDLKTQLKVYTIWALSGLIDSVFLAFWVFITWFVDEKIISYFQVYGIDKLVLTTFQALFALSTLAPIIIYTIGDISRMVVQARRNLLQEIGRSGAGKKGKSR